MGDMAQLMASSDGSVVYDYFYNETEITNQTAKSLAGPIGVIILSIFGLVGNISIIYLVLRHKQLRNPPNILIINMTVGDLLYILSAATFFVEKELSPSWEATLFTCKLKSYIEDVGQSVCVFSLAALSRERYLAIVCGIETRQRRGSCANNGLCAVAVVLITACLIGIPSFVFTSKPTVYHCKQIPHDSTTAKVFVSVRSLLGYVVPMCIISIYYILIAHSLYRSVQQFSYSESHVQQSRLRKRLAGIVLFIAVLFAIFWLPHFLHLHAKVYASADSFYQSGMNYIDYLRIVGFLMALTNSCSNPWVVFIMSSTYRKHCCLFQLPCNKQGFKRGRGTRLTTLTGTTRRTSANVSQMSHV